VFRDGFLLILLLVYTYRAFMERDLYATVTDILGPYFGIVHAVATAFTCMGEC